MSLNSPIEGREINMVDEITKRQLPVENGAADAKRSFRTY